MFDLNTLRDPALGPKRQCKFYFDEPTQQRVRRAAEYTGLDMSDLLTRMIHTYLPEDPTVVPAPQPEEFKLD